MRFGLVMMGRPPVERDAGRVAQLSNPSHISMVDFDRDGMKDFFVADLGRLPALRPHSRSSSCCCADTRDGKYQQLELDGWPRVADVETADFNGDGTEDVVVAAFGWRKVGNLSVLENHTTDYSRPSFVTRVHRCAAGRDSRDPDRSEQGRQARPRRALRAAIRERRRVHQQRHDRRELHAHGALLGAASQLGIVGHSARRSRPGRRSGRDPHARRHAGRFDHQAVSRDPVARESGQPDVRGAQAGGSSRSASRPGRGSRWRRRPRHRGLRVHRQRSRQSTRRRCQR